MNSEHHNPPHSELQPGAENAAEFTKPQLDKLLGDAEAVYNGIGEQLRTIGETHVQRHKEADARDEVRMHSLHMLRNAINDVLESETMDKSTFDRLQTLEERARDGHREVVGETEQLYTPHSVDSLAGGLAQNRGKLEHDARSSVAVEPANQDNLPDSFFKGLKNINEAVYQLDEMRQVLERMHVDDRHLQDAFYALGRQFGHLPISYDSDAVASLRRSVEEVISYAEDSDRSRLNVHKIAIEVRTVADNLLDAAHELAQSRR